MITAVLDRVPEEQPLFWLIAGAVGYGVFMGLKFYTQWRLNNLDEGNDDE